MDTLKKAFSKACETFPALKDKTPVGMGSYGLVVEDGPATLTKILFMPEYEDAQRWVGEMLDNEIAVMQFFTRQPADGITTPVLLKEFEPSDQKDYYGSYRMTRVPGIDGTASWAAAGTLTEKENLARSAGKMLARFHAAAASMPFELLTRARDGLGARVPDIPWLAPQTREAMKTVDAYLQANKKPGVGHGDFHNGNIIYQNGEATGLLDFSSTGWMQNTLCDFMCIHQDVQESFIKGYEDQSGHTVNRTAIAATALALSADYLSWNEDKPEIVTQCLVEINRRLNEMVYLTGFKP